jgi:rubrerythrin
MAGESTVEWVVAYHDASGAAHAHYGVAAKSADDAIRRLKKLYAWAREPMSASSYTVPKPQVARQVPPFECDICGTTFSMPSYGGGDCPMCGQAYEYEEAHRIVLSEEQLALLRLAWKEKR